MSRQLLIGDPLTHPVTPPAGQNVTYDISQHLLDGLTQNAVQTFMVLSANMRLIFAVLNEMSQQLLAGFPFNVQTFMFPTG